MWRPRVCPSTRHYVKAQSVSQHSSLCEGPECVPALVIMWRPRVCPSTRHYSKTQCVSQHS
ncbi:hypothetical protein DPMN_020567 [Dreissena polymorpha]|uniref:Uncharacterized protein n=1 Tax=Dreissena polymorpha TaxID=45954 RepID=A0A9D4NJ41_DREPO|nr:hypothetical protein DPMN_020567 [Dreissena polymorpha]